MGEVALLMKGFKKGKKFIPTDSNKETGLKIDEITTVEDLKMDNPNQAQFVSLAKNRIQQDSKQLKDLKKVKLQEHRRGEARAEKIPLGKTSEDGFEIVARYTKSDDPKEINGIIKHEIDHIYYAETEEANPEKIRQFILELGEAPPFTKDLEDLRKEIEKSNDPDPQLLRRYYDEYHSEIGQVNERIKLGLLNKSDVEQRVNLEAVTKAYSKLHGSAS